MSIIGAERANEKRKQSMSERSVDKLCIDTIRTLSMDAVQKANSGHPGTPMALAPVVYTLWQHFLKFDPDDPLWPNRDRFVLSNGHASMLLYAILHLASVKEVTPDNRLSGESAVSLDDIEHFRELDSNCLLYTSDAADDLLCVDLGGRRIIK